jgi:hypothetical protein
MEAKKGQAPSVRSCEKSTIPVILSEARNLQLFVFKRINADASLRSAER